MRRYATPLRPYSNSQIEVPVLGFGSFDLSIKR